MIRRYISSVVIALFAAATAVTAYQAHAYFIPDPDGRGDTISCGEPYYRNWNTLCAWCRNEVSGQEFELCVVDPF